MCIERLRDVPPMCEHCYGPVDLVKDSIGHKVCRAWPDTFESGDRAAVDQSQRRGADRVDRKRQPRR